MDMYLKPLLTLAVIGFVFIALERLRPVRQPPTARWRRYTTDLLHLTAGGFLIRVAAAALLTWLLARAHVTELGSDLPLWLQFVCVLSMGDLTIWLTHRLFHAVPALWEFHKIHHSSQHLDWLASFRVHPVEQVVTAVLVPLPPLLLGFSPGILLLYMAVYQWHAVLLHSNVAVSLGPLERVIATNRFHHWHHADHVEAYDRNFGAQLTIWDHLFGTAYSAGEARPERFGVDDAPRESFLSHLVSPFTRSIFR